MSDHDDATDKQKKDRSPSFPFISLRKAEERARTLWDKHRRESARLIAIAPTWGYTPKSSGLSQTVGALKQYGLIEDTGSGDGRKIQLSDLGRRLVADQREGARDEARKEAALRPRLFQEYRRWIADPPSESHCLSELELDRGFNLEAARTFLRSFFDTASFANLKESQQPAGRHEDDADAEAREETSRSDAAERALPSDTHETPAAGSIRLLPLAQRLKLAMTVGALTISADLRSAAEVDALIAMLQANKPLLDQG